MILATALLLLNASGIDAGPPPVRPPLVQPVSRSRGDDADEADPDETPDGCLHWLLCYNLPDSADSSEWTADNKWMHLIAQDLLKLLPFGSIWGPLVLHFAMVDESSRPPLEGRLLLVMLLAMFGPSVLSIAMIPLAYLPFGYLVYVVVLLGVTLWIAPVTLIHAYNTAQKQAGLEEEDRPKKKKKSKRSPKRRKAAPDEDYDDE